MRGLLAWLVLLGCSDPSPRLERTLERVGPVRVTVDELGSVSLPEVRWSDGVPADEVRWSVVGGDAARVGAEGLEAVGPGQALLRGELDGQVVSFTLVVEPTVRLDVVPPPTQLGVGQQFQLQVTPTIEGMEVPDIQLDWRSSDAALASVDPLGVVEGRAPGLVYVTVDAGRSQAMIELEVVP